MKFGMVPAEVKEVCGTPDTTDEGSGPWPQVFFGWQYKALDVDVFFRRPSLLWKPNDPFRLIMFTCGHPDLTLWGNRIMGLPEPELLGILASYGDYRREPLEPLTENLSPFHIPDLDLDFILRKGRVLSCQWRWRQGIGWEEGSVAWPSQKIQSAQ
jgi:hypothetical protein